MRQECSTSTAGVALLLLSIFLTGCASSLYGWQVRTNSTPMPPSFSQASFEQYPVAMLRGCDARGTTGKRSGTSPITSVKLLAKFGRVGK